MNTPDFTSDQSDQSTRQPAERPLGYWLRTVDHSIKRSMHDTLTEDGLGRRAWRTLSVIESGATSVDAIDAALPQRRRGPRGPKGFSRRLGFAPDRGFGRPEGVDHGRRGQQTTAADTEQTERAPHEHHQPGRDRDFGPGARLGRGATRDFGGVPFGPDFRGVPFGQDFREHHGPRGRRRSTEEIVMDFAARGWVTIDAAGITLTEAGREAHAALRTKVDAVRQTVTDAVSPEDLATTLASLESIARAFGWDENTAHEHGPRSHFGRGPRGHREGFGHRDGRRRGEGRCGHADREHSERSATGTTPDVAR